ncbi:hypothetical protein MGYG_01422 [Nannizzia gypsea CBS 118893]|uniref:Uncharacterized protein n=1 Tax=Arthroderma gypseum (strain ATCC MYA-4604 / CBS 118893) TaxID=535722 RepID=E5R0V0_ARTGP|nr:hypothetical protein MGYG_01422 [Nannizzia gypsea CBS 118893]EFQ98392.1 hypothetical protein MGYG_01422 [Nannizzia gypsea CBS 118893]
MTRPVSASRTTAGRPSVAKSRHALRRRNYPSRSRNRQRQHRLALGGNTRSQKTLTQLNFVLPHDSSDSDDANGDFQLLEAEASRCSEIEGQKPKKQTMENHGKKGKRRQDHRPNRTLTQMVNVDWTHPRPERSDTGDHARHPRKRRGVEMESILECAENVVDEDGSFNPPVDNVSNKGENGVEAMLAKQEPSYQTILSEKAPGHGEMLPPANPVTPRKQTSRVIPSSQSPESPEITLNSPRTPRNMKNNPLRLSLASPEVLLSPSPNKRRRSLLRFDANDYDSQVVLDDGFVGNYSAPGSPASVLSSPKAVSDPSVSFREEICSRFNAARRERQIEEVQTLNRRQPESIVYETDGEAELDSIEDECSNLPGISGARKLGDSSGRDTPLLAPECNTEQSSQNLPTSTYMSDTMSLYYTRQPMSYAFEKFHPSQLLRDVSESARDTEIVESSQPNPLPTFDSGSQEIPAKGRPRVECENASSTHQSDTEPNQPPLSLSPVVQVESSQRSQEEVEVEVPSSQTLETENGSRRIITCSQLLTESLLESIPGPPAWISGSHNNDLNDLNDHAARHQS